MARFFVSQSPYTFQATEDEGDATELDTGVPYRWRDWSFVRSHECLFAWNEFSCLELSSVSNGWFRYLIDSKVATMYSSGSAESGPDPFESRGEFVDKVDICMYRYFVIYHSTDLL